MTFPILSFIIKMTKTEGTKYQCGCGKIYSSYPAFSNHKKCKHANHSQPGTKIPKPYNPKRGRPSFTLPNKQKNNNYSAYSALTCIEIGLLKLEDTYKGLLSQADEEANLQILNAFQICEKIATNKAGQKILSGIKKFTEIMITHLTDKIAQVVVDYFVLVSIFILQNIPSEEISLNWGSQFDDSCFRIDPALFNRFFQQKGQIERTRQLGKRIEMPLEFLLNLTVMLSQYLHILDLATSTLIMKA